MLQYVAVLVSLIVLVFQTALASLNQECVGWHYSPQFTKPVNCTPCCSSKCTASDGEGGTHCWAGDAVGVPFSCADNYTFTKSGRTALVDGYPFEHYSCCQPGAPDTINASNCPRVDCLEHAGLQRCWETFRPSKPGMAVRVVIDLHGYSGNMVSHQQYSGWNRMAERDGFLVVYPQGTADADNNPFWNAGRCCGESDDIGFLEKLAASVAATHGVIDLKRHVYWAGHSNGCAMAQRMAAQAPHIVAAVGCHSFYLLLNESDFPISEYAFNRVPIIEIHGTKDQVVSYDGFMGTSATENLKTWARHNGCPSPANPLTCVIADKEKTGMGEVLFSRHTSCEGATEVALLTLPGVGHFPYKGMQTDVDTTQVQIPYVE